MEGKTIPIMILRNVDFKKIFSLKQLKLLIFSFGILVILCLHYSVASAAWDVNYDELSNGFNNIVYGKGLFVAAGGKGIIKTSTDGQNWTMRMHQTENGKQNFYNLIYENNQFIAISLYYIYSSYDGIKWTKIYNNNDLQLSYMAFNGKVYSAIGRNGFYYSKDLKNWTLAKNSKYKIGNWGGLIWGGNRFVAVGDSNIKISSDGITWVDSKTKIMNSRGNIIWSGKCYYTYKVDCSEDLGKNYLLIFQSKDGSVWNQFSKINIGDATEADSLTYICNTYYINYGGVTYYSYDLKKWNKIDGALLGAISYNGTKFVADGYISRDGLNWNKFSWGKEYNYICAATNEKNLVLIEHAFSVDADYKIIVKHDGIYEEKYRTEGTLNDGFSLNKVIYENGRYIVVGSRGLILISYDGLVWSPVETKANVSDIQDIIWDGKFFIAISKAGIIKSQDGFNWEGSSPEKFQWKLITIDWTDEWIGEGISRIIYFKNNYYIFGTTKDDKLKVLKSKDLENWEASSPDFKDFNIYIGHVNDVKVVNNEILIFAYSGEVRVSYIYSSKDGAKWDIKKAISDINIQKIAFNGKNYICNTEYGLYISKDCIKWTLLDFPIMGYSATNYIINEGENFIVVGGWNIIARGKP